MATGKGYRVMVRNRVSVKVTVRVRRRVRLTLTVIITLTGGGILLKSSWRGDCKQDPCLQFPCQFCGGEI